MPRAGRVPGRLIPDKGVTQQGPRELKGVVHSGPIKSSCDCALSGCETSAEPWVWT